MKKMRSLAGVTLAAALLFTGSAGAAKPKEQFNDKGQICRKVAAAPASRIMTRVCLTPDEWKERDGDGATIDTGRSAPTPPGF